MPKLSPSALKARIDRLQKQLTAIESKKTPAIKKVLSLMKKLGVTVADLKESNGAAVSRAASASRREPVAKNTRASKSRSGGGKVAPKYRDDKGNTWTGRGKTPRWLVAAEKAGKSRDTFKIA